jgi:hypothetical protein
MGLDAMRLQAARLSRPELLIEKRETLRQTGDRIIEIPLGPSRPNSLPGRRTAGSAGDENRDESARENRGHSGEVSPVTPGPRYSC